MIICYYVCSTKKDIKNEIKEIKRLKKEEIEKEKNLLLPQTKRDW